MTEGHHGASSAHEAEAAPEIKKTSRTDKVAGYSCDIWEVTGKDHSGEACIATVRTSWLHLPFSGLPAKFAWASMLDGNNLPLRFVGFEKGVETGRVEVTSIEQKPLEKSQFEVPAGYAVMDLQQMMAGMFGAPGGAGAPSGMPPGVVLPPGVTLPPGFKLPAGVKGPPASKPPKH
jgi:hypothetical protein